MPTGPRVCTQAEEWMRILGITAGLLELTVGIPLGIATTINFGRFSMFSLVPILS